MITVRKPKESMLFSFEKTHRLDLTNASQLKRKVLRRKDLGYNKVMIDLEGIRFIDTAGFSILLTIQGGIEAAGSEFRIINVSDEVMEMIHLLKLEKVLNLAKNPDRIETGSWNRK